MRWLTIKFLSLLCCIVIFSASASAQVQEIDPEDTDEETFALEDNPLKNRIVLGGSVSAQFGNSTYIEVSPNIGYKITKNLTSGVGITYQYQSVNYNSLFVYDYKGSVYGGKIFSQYNLFYGLFAHAEYEHLWYKFVYEDSFIGTLSDNVPALFLGGGYNFKIGKTAQLQIMALYDVLHTEQSLYYNPLVFRMGFNIGL